MEESLDMSVLCWGLTARQPLWIILYRLPEKERTEIEEIVEEMKGRDQGRKRNKKESEETEKILYPYLLQG